MSDTPGSRSGNRTPLDEGDVESMPVSLTTSPRKLVQAVRQLQAEKRASEAHGRSLCRKLKDIENGLSDSRQPKSKRSKTSHGHKNPDKEESDDFNHVEHSIIQAGHKFCITCCPWLHSGALLFRLDLDEDYDPAERADSGETKCQAQLWEVWDLLQSKFEAQDLKQAWIGKAVRHVFFSTIFCKQTVKIAHTQFMHGVNTQRSNTATRIRRHCTSIFGVDEPSVLQPENRREKFRNRIGWVVDPKGNGSYSSVDVEILHKTYSGEYNPASAFLSPILMGIFIAIIRGPTSAKEFMLGITSNPRTETMASIHSLRNITPGAIASAAIFARWALSADVLFQTVGSSTGINYLADYEEYLNLLQTGLRRKKKATLNVFKEWDRLVFPNTGTSLVGGSQLQESAGMRKAMALLDADESEPEENEN